MRGIWSRPIAKGEVEEDLAGGSAAGVGRCLLLEVSAPEGACSWGGGCLLRGVVCVWTSPHDGYCCGWYASYWNAFLLVLILKEKTFGVE